MQENSKTANLRFRIQSLEAMCFLELYCVRSRVLRAFIFFIYKLIIRRLVESHGVAPHSLDFQSNA